MASASAATAVPPGEGEFAFGCEFLDPITNNLRVFNVAVWEKDASVEVYDPKARRTVLKRCVPFESVRVDDFVISNTVTVMGRSYLVKSYLNAATRARFTTVRETSICLIKPDGLPHMGSLVTELLDSGFDIGAMKLCKLSHDEAGEFLESKRGSSTYAESVRFLCSDAVLALLVTAENAVSKLQGVAGPADPADATEALPDSIRARFGTDAVRNAVHVSATAEDAVTETAFLFDSARTVPAVYRHCSAVVVRPHAVRARAAGKVMQALLDSGLEISGVRTLSMEGRDIEDYLEAYKGVLPEYGKWLTELASGQCVVLEVRGEGVVPQVRAICGPYCPEIARHLRPASLRAQFGVDRTRNAVLCTDIERDGPLESKFLFCVADG